MSILQLNKLIIRNVPIIDFYKYQLLSKIYWWKCLSAAVENNVWDGQSWEFPGFGRIRTIKEKIQTPKKKLKSPPLFFKLSLSLNIFPAGPCTFHHIVEYLRYSVITNSSTLLYKILSLLHISIILSMSLQNWIICNRGVSYWTILLIACVK